MEFITLKDLHKLFKKRYKIFILYNLLIISILIIANFTILREKLSKNYSIIFDYEFEYNWTENSRKNIEYVGIISNLSTGKISFAEVPFLTLKELHANYFSLLYKFNIDDLKTNDFEGKYNKIARSFNYDTTNFQYKNRKLHLSWYNLEEAEEYLESLHNRASSNLKSIFEIYLKTNRSRIIEELNIFLKVFSLSELKEHIIKEMKLENDYAFEKYIKDRKIYLDKLDNNQLLSLAFEGYFFPKMDPVFFVKEQNLLIYILKERMKGLDLSKINYFPEINDLIDNFEKFLPVYNKKVNKISFYYIYIIEILTSLLISSLILITSNIKRKN